MLWQKLFNKVLVAKVGFHTISFPAQHRHFQRHQHQHQWSHTSLRLLQGRLRRTVQTGSQEALQRGDLGGRDLQALEQQLGALPGDELRQQGADLDHRVVEPDELPAQRLDTPPFRAYPVTGGITFTYGGLRVDGAGAVLRDDGSRIDGLFACGELVGGVFFGGYPGGSGLTSGAVFGRRAGTGAAARAGS